MARQVGYPRGRASDGVDSAGRTARKDLGDALVYTIGAVVIYELGLQMPLPGVEHERLFGLLSFPDTGFSRLFPRGPAVFTLGILPYVGASILMLLLSGVVPSLRRLRDGPPEANARFDRFIYGVTVVFAFVQAWSLASMLDVGTSTTGADPDTGFRVRTVSIAFTGAILVMWMAHEVTRHGLVNGVILLLFVDFITAAIGGVGALARESLSARQLALVLVAVTGLGAVCLHMVKAGHRIPLRHALGDRGTTLTPSIVLRTNMVGVLPVSVASAAMLPVSQAGIKPGSTVSWIVYCGLIVLFTYVWTAASFSGVGVVDRVRRFGFDLPEVAAASGDHLDRIVERQTARHAALLVCLALAAPVLLERFGISRWSSWLAGPWLLVAAAIGVTIVDRLRELSRQDGQPDQAGPDWVPVFEGVTELEVDLARAALERAGIPARRSSNRAIPATGTLALWEVSRPPYPSWTMIHRHLGGGRAFVLVPAEQVSQAQRIVAPHGGAAGS